MAAPRLVIFDVDGTLVDSQAHILASMAGAFGRQDLDVPDRADILAIVGLSLPEAMFRLAPYADLHQRDRLVADYKATFVDLRAAGDPVVNSPLFPGAIEVLEHLHADPDTTLAVATGKSRRGLAHVLETAGIGHFFDSTQVADDHPSKPHPSMVEACLTETGIEPGAAVIVGDTEFDVAMGRAAGIAAIGVTWGYHPAGRLTAAGANALVDRFGALPAALANLQAMA